jgi:hypothetical protein
MPIDAKHEDLQSLRIDRTAARTDDGEPPAWASRYIVIGIAIVVLLGLSALAYRFLSRDVPEVEVVRASAETSDVRRHGAFGHGLHRGSPHHQREFQSDRAPRLDRRGKGRQSKRRPGSGAAGRRGIPRQLYEQAKGALENARAYLEELQHGSRPEEIQQAQHNLDEARATLVNDKLTLDRTKELAGCGRGFAPAL